jgi:hypothetical protein
MATKSTIGAQKVVAFKAKKTKQGAGRHSKPRHGRKMSRGQGR